MNGVTTNSGVTRNSNFAKLQAGYLFPEIARRRNAYLAQNPNAKIISLGIGLSSFSFLFPPLFI